MAESDRNNATDDELLELLRDAVNDRSEPKASMVDMIMAGYDITNADASLAQLIDDTQLNELASIRSSTDTAHRLLGFAGNSISFEFELRSTEPHIVGHVEGATGGTIHLEQLAGSQSTELDTLGQFEFSLRSQSPFRLRFSEPNGPSTATEWILP